MAYCIGPISGCYINPAIFRAFESTVALEQVWVFIVAPVIGAVLAAFLWKYLKNGVKE